MDYLLDGIRGLIEEPGRVVMMLIGCLLIFLAIKKGLEPALLLPMGFGQGTGQALNIGKVFESLGFENGSAFGLSIAAIGFLVACIVGVIYLNVLKKQGKISVQLTRKDNSNDRDIL